MPDPTKEELVSSISFFAKGPVEVTVDREMLVASLRMALRSFDQDERYKTLLIRAKIAAAICDSALRRVERLLVRLREVEKILPGCGCSLGETCTDPVCERVRAYHAKWSRK